MMASATHLYFYVSLGILYISFWEGQYTHMTMFSRCFIYCLIMFSTPFMSPSFIFVELDMWPGISRILKCEREGPESSIRSTWVAKFLVPGPRPLLMPRYSEETYRQQSYLVTCGDIYNGGREIYLFYNLLKLLGTERLPDSLEALIKGAIVHIVFKPRDSYLWIDDGDLELVGSAGCSALGHDACSKAGATAYTHREWDVCETLEKRRFSR